MIYLLYRCTFIEGGSTTLITRFGVASWVISQRAKRDGNGVLFTVLAKKLEKTMDLERIGDWAGEDVFSWNAPVWKWKDADVPQEA